MPSATPAPIVSGMPYPVVSVGGHPCRSLSDLVGNVVQFTIEHHGLYTAKGSSGWVGDIVRFHEKDGGGIGKDIRVWQLSHSEAAGFTAEHVVG